MSTLLGTVIGPLGRLLEAFMGGEPAPSDDGYCHCPEPLLDDDVAGDGIGESDWCWRCRLPLDESVGEPVASQ